MREQASGFGSHSRSRSFRIAKQTVSVGEEEAAAHLAAAIRATTEAQAALRDHVAYHRRPDNGSDE